jgi:hypothetical protein
MELPEPFSDMLVVRELNAKERGVVGSDARILAVEIWYTDEVRKKKQLIVTRFVVGSSSGAPFATMKSAHIANARKHVCKI